MGLLDKIERSMERLVEGTVGGVFRQTLQPAEITRKLERAMSGGKRAGVNTAIVPNSFAIRLHPLDYAQFTDSREGFARRFEAELAGFAARQRYTCIGNIQVVIEESQTARRRTPDITGKISDRRRPAEVPAPRPHPTPAAERTAAFPQSRTVHQVQFAVIGGIAAGQTFTIPYGTSTLGRAADNSIVLDAPDVSRLHARIERSGESLRIYDLNSTNGTRVNGDSVRLTDLGPGDEIRIGKQVLRVSFPDAG